ncbi:hypothetical protein O6H91_17G030600 [Diphasiastrum complanatum]|uniref:Uncharacterized protein n=1 Tax=Diphasiastrum complanatum TaxID=34168 RepID=A0ACC2B5F8_DIPCM|nr:hypothetical protein O6H91_17G030600 [Diphasiastrum complanatum]
MDACSLSTKFQAGILVLFLISQCAIKGVIALDCNNPRDKGNKDYNRRCGGKNNVGVISGKQGGGNSGGSKAGLSNCNNGGLQIGFYSRSCPNAENIVRGAFAGNFLSDPTAPAALLRLAFHDCQVGGCDASILLDSTSTFQSEQRSDRNFGIRRLDFIDRIKASLEAVCPGIVSCADIIILVARDSISLTGGPRFPVQTGRRDSLTASNIAADASIPPASVSINNFLSTFQSKGMTVEESVAILGAHTIGVGHCVNIVDRLYPTTDPRLGALFSAQLRLQCPTGSPQTLNNNTVINNDLTNVIFDNQYFRDVMNGRGLFTIDAELGQDSRTSAAVAQFAQNQQLFFSTFISAFNKLAATNVLTSNNGQIRRNCHVVN